MLISANWIHRGKIRKEEKDTTRAKAIDFCEASNARKKLTEV